MPPGATSNMLSLRVLRRLPRGAPCRDPYRLGAHYDRDEGGQRFPNSNAVGGSYGGHSAVASTDRPGGRQRGAPGVTLSVSPAEAAYVRQGRALFTTLFRGCGYDFEAPRWDIRHLRTSQH